jgi:hypothetical protein
VGAESCGKKKKALPWDITGHGDPLGVPTLERGIFPLIHIQLEKKNSLLVPTQRIDEDRVVACSIWSLDQGVIIPQRCGTTPGQSRNRDQGLSSG